MSTGASSPAGTNGTLNAPGSGGITDAPFYGTPMQQFADPFHLFPSPIPDNSPPAQLPNLGIDPTFYSASSFTPRKASAPGAFNQMVAGLAGPVYVPTVTQGNRQTGAPAGQPTGGPQIPPALMSYLSRTTGGRP